MKAPWSLAPLTGPTVAFMTGIALSFTEIPMGVAFCVIPIAAILFLYSRSLPAVMAVFLTVGFIDGCIHRPDRLPPWTESIPATYSGVITDIDDGPSASGAVITIDSIDRMPVRPIRISATIPPSVNSIRIADRIAFRSKIEPVVPVKDLPYEIDYSDYLIREGIYGSVYLPPDSIDYVIPEPGILNIVRRYRDDVTHSLYTSGLSSGASGFLAAVITGDDTGLQQNDKEDFTRAGQAHVLALSGLHVAIISWLAAIALWPVYIAGFRRTRFIVVILVLWGYAVMTGMSPSVTRAVIMFTVFAVGLIAGRRRSPVNSLCVAALAILAFSPRSLVSPGFQLSFVAVLSIIVIVPLLNRVDRRHTLLYGLANIIMVPLAAMAGTGILGAFYFHTFPIYLLLSGIITGIMLPPLLTGGILTSILNLSSFPTEWLVKPLNLLYSLTDAAVSWVAALPMSMAEGIRVSLPTVFLCLATSAMLALCLHRRTLKRVIGTGFLMAAAIASCLIRPDGYPDDELFFVRNRNSTDIVLRHNSEMTLISFAQSAVLRHESHQRALKRYRLYMSLHGIDTIKMADASLETPLAVLDGNRLSVAGTDYLILDGSKYTTCEKAPDIIIVASGFRKSVIDAVHATGASHVILSCDLNKRRRERYMSELKSAGISHSMMETAAPSLASHR